MTTDLTDNQEKDKYSQGTEKFLNAHPSSFGKYYDGLKNKLNNRTPFFFKKLFTQKTNSSPAVSLYRIRTQLNNIASRLTTKFSPKLIQVTLISLFLLTSIILGFIIVLSRPPKPPQISNAPSNSLYLYQTGNADYQAKIGSKNTSEPFVSFTSPSGTGATIEMIGSQSIGTVQEGNKVTYENIFPHTNVTYTPLINGIKEEIIVSQPTGKTEYTFNLRTNTKPRSITTGQYSSFFFDDNAKYQFHLEKPFAVDSRGNRTEDIVMSIRQSKEDTDLYQIKLTVSPDWLNATDRVYPITIDPTIVYDTTAEFAAGILNRVVDTGSGSTPSLETYYQELPSDSHTVGLWHFNEASGNVLDSSGNSNTGTPTGTTVNTTNPRLGSAARTFNGSSDYISVTDTTALDLLGNNLTLEAWVYQTASCSTYECAVISKGYSTTYKYFLSATSTGYMFALYNGTVNPTVTSTGTPQLNTWVHLAGTYDGQNLILYVNGEEVGRTSMSMNLNNQATAVVFGRRDSDSGPYFTGSIDEVRISNIARSAEEMRMNARRRPYSVYTSDIIDFSTIVSGWSPISWTELGVTTTDAETLYNTTSLIAHWKFNETSGTTATNNAGSCSSSCNGTLTNFSSTGSQDASGETGWTSNNRRWGAGALMMNGSIDDAYVTCTDANCGGTSNLDIGSRNWTIATWLKTASSSARMSVVSKGTATTQYSYQLEIDLGKPVFRLYNNSDTAYMINSSNISVNDGNWHYIVGTYDGTTLSTYVDGILNASSTSKTGTQVTNSTSNFQIGARTDSPAQAFYGIIDNVYIFARALTPSEIVSNYNSSNVELQTRVGSDTSPDDGSWEAWSPITGETQINSFDEIDNFEINTRIYENTFNDIGTGLVWTKYDNSEPSASDTTSTNGRVPKGTAGKADASYAWSPAVIKDGSTYKMWYNTYGGGGVGYATSPDGLTWTKYDNTIAPDSNTGGTNGRIPQGLTGTGDDGTLFGLTVIKDDNTYKAWYTATDGSTSRIYYATSPDGLTWTKYDNTIPSNSDSTSTNGRIPLGITPKGDFVEVIQLSVIKDGSFYKMWYTGYDGFSERIYYATSPDGLTWTKYDNTIPTASNTTGTNGRIPLGTSGGDTANVFGPSVIKDGNIYKMWYTGQASSDGFLRIFYATSLDGLTWTKYNNAIPSASNTVGTNGALPIGTSGGDSNHVQLPSVIKDGNVYKMWYTGYGSGSAYQIFHATMPVTPVTNTLDTVIKVEGTGSNKFTFGQTQAKNGTVGLWRFEEAGGTGAYIKDSSGNANHGTPTGTTIVDGISGKARSMAAGTITVPDHSSLKPTNITIEAWVKPVSGLIVYKYHSSSPFEGYGLHVGPVYTGIPGCWVGGSAWTSATSYILDGNWHYLACTYDGTYARIFVDGKLENTQAQSAVLSYAQDLDLGGSGSSNIIDEIRISNVSKTYLEIAEEYRLHRDFYINKTISADLSGKTTLPFYIAADRPGTYLQAIAGESNYANYQPDSFTKALWHLDEENTYSKETFVGTSINTSKWVEIDVAANKISQNSGLVFAAGSTAAWDAALISKDTFNRIIGQTLYAKFTTGASVAAPNHMMIGWANDSTVIASHTNITHALYLNAGAFYVYQDGTLFGGPYGSNYVANTTYEFKITLSSANVATYSVRGGVYTNWTTLLATDGTKSNTPLRAQISTWQMTGTMNELTVVQGSTLTDVSGNGNNATVGGVYPIQGKLGYGKDFNGASDFINVVDSNSLSFGTSGVDTSFSISAWVKPSNITTTTNLGNWIISKRDTSTNDEYQLAFFQGLLYFSLFTNQSNSMSRITTTTWPAGQWYHIVATYNGSEALSGMKIYVNGVLQSTTTSTNGTYTGMNNGSQPVVIGKASWANSLHFAGTIDEVRLDAVERTADEVRQAYEVGLRSHLITIDFAADLNSGNLIANSADLSFTVDATAYGLQSAGDKLFKGDKIIIKENYNGTEYIAQGTVDSTNTSTGATTVTAWDSGSTFPSGGFTINATVFKWQREYWTVDGGVLDSSLNAITTLSLRLTDGNMGRTVWLDDLRSNSSYLTTPSGSAITSSTGNRYLQYRIINSSIDQSVSATVSAVTVDYTPNVVPNTPTLDVPANSATGVLLSPALKTTATDTDSDYLRYKITLCTDAGMSVGCQTFDQTSSQTGWSGQNTQTSTAYTSGTQATYTVQTPLTPNTVYYWKSTAIDPGGINSFGATQVTANSFTTNVIPGLPTLDLPANAATSVTITTAFKTTATDSNSDYLRYKIVMCTNLAMTINCQTFDQTSSQTGWSGQNTQTSTAYTSGTQATYTVQTNLLTGTQYFWQSYAIDPGGTNTFSATQTTPYSFTTISNPAQPSTCTVTKDSFNTQIVLNWRDNSTTENGYQIWKITDGGAPVHITPDLNPNTITYTDTDIASNHTYGYLIRNFQTDGSNTLYSAWCPTATSNLHVGGGFTIF